MKQTLQLKLSQHLTLTPQLQQSIRLLQLSTLELNAEVEQMLQENPLLEKIDGEDEPPLAGAAPPGSSDAARFRSAQRRGPTTARRPPTARPAADVGADARRPSNAPTSTIIRRRRCRLGQRQRTRRRRWLLPAAGRGELAARSPDAAARGAQSAAARPADRRGADRRARRGRLPPHLARGDRRDVPETSSISSRTSSRSRFVTCKASSRPASARATPPNA